MMPDTMIASQQPIEFDLYGIITLRLINPTRQDVAAIASLCGPAQPASAQVADITIRFTEKLHPPSLTYLGLNNFGFNNEGFYLLDEKDGQARVRVPFAEIGGPCELFCQQGIGVAPLLEEIINLTFLSKNYIPLHASAFVYQGQGVLVMGWSKGGKTETLLSFAQQGATYVGDEWVVLSGDGQRMFGLGHRITIREWQFQYIPHLLPPVSRSQKLFSRGVHLLDKLHKTVARGPRARQFPWQQMGKALPLLKDQLKIVTQPETLFAQQHQRQTAAVDMLILAMSHSDAATRIEPCQTCEIAERMSHSNAYELLYFFKQYQAFKFAFPGCRNEFLETIMTKQEKMLCQALSGKPAYKLLHPYPVAFESLFEQVQGKLPCSP